MVQGENFLPEQLRGNFAFPQNAELLFLWPVLFSHSQQFVDALNVPFVFLSVLALYALCRHFGISRNNALFAGLLYAMTPVVLMQAGCAYVDVPVLLMLLLSMYYSLRFHSFGRRLDLLAAGMSVGLLCGMKYTSLPLALPLQLLVLPRLVRERRRDTIAYGMLVFLLAGWWYVRNAVALADPFFPMGHAAASVNGQASSPGNTILDNIRENLKPWVMLFPFQDIGLGTHDGGFGMVFWGIGLPSWVAVILPGLCHPVRTGMQKLIVLAYLPIGFILLLMLPTDFVIWDGRLGLVVVAAGIIALCLLLVELQDRTWTVLIKSTCVIMSVAAFCLLYTAERPTYRFGDAMLEGASKTSEFKYLRSHLFEPYHSLRYVWEPLDYFSLNRGSGFTCTLVTEHGVMCMTGPMYGSRLQNQILNFRQHQNGLPDVYVYTHTGKNVFRPTALPPDLHLDGQTTIQGLMAGDDYEVVTASEYGDLLIRRELIEQPELQHMLKVYYERTWPEAVVSARELAGRIDPSVPIVTSSEIGYGFRVLDIEGSRKNRVYMTMNRQVEQIASRRNFTRCYSFRKPLRGYDSRRIGRISCSQEHLDVYLNSLAH